METENNYQKENAANTKVYYHSRNHERAYRRRRNGVLLGLLIILIGSLHAYSSYEMIETDSLQWQIEHILFSWPIIPTVFSLFCFLKGEWVGGVFWLLLGTAFIAPELSDLFAYGGIEVSSALIVSCTVIVFGIFILLYTLLRKNNTKVSSRWKRHEEFLDDKAMKEGINEEFAQAHFGMGEDNRIDYHFILSGADHVFVEPVFPGGNIKCVFGGMELDLRHTDLQPGVTYLNIDATFGGVSLKVPANWVVEIRSNCIIGGFVDERRFFNANPDYDRKLVINARCILGGGSVE